MRRLSAATAGSQTLTAPPRLQDGRTPLHCAAWFGHEVIIATLLATPGVDPTLGNNVSGCIHSMLEPDPWKRTRVIALYLLCYEGLKCQTLPALAGLAVECNTADLCPDAWAVRRSRTAKEGPARRRGTGAQLDALDARATSSPVVCGCDSNQAMGYTLQA